MARSDTHDRELQALRAFGLAYPGAHTKSPWPGHLDLAVNGKTFAYLSVDGEPFHISCKLPQSGQDALWLPFAKPTGYGLGRSGWVTAELADDEPVPVALFQRWIDESYRAQAPKKLVAQLGLAADGGATEAAARTTATPRAKAGKAAAAPGRVAARAAKAVTQAPGAAATAAPVPDAGAAGKRRR